MKIIVPVIAALALAGQASAVVPSKAAAVTAVKRQVTVETGKRVWRLGRVACVSPAGSGVVFACDFKAGHATVIFRGGKADVHILWVTR
jgi:hypothetical protein